MKNRLITGVILIVAAVILASVYIPKIKEQKENSYSVVVLKKNVNASERITAADLTTVYISDNEITGRVFSDPSELEGRTAARNLLSDSFVFLGDVIEGDLYPTIYNSLADNELMISVTASALSYSLSGQLRSGDIVRFYTVDEEGDAYTPQELEYIEVAAIFTDSGILTEDSEEMPSTIAVYVNQAQALRVVELESKGRTHFALVSRGNPDYAYKLLTGGATK